MIMFPDSVTVISDEVSQDLDAVAAFVRDLKLPGIELRSAFGRAFKDLTPEDVDRVADRAKREGWRIVGCSTPVFKCALGDATAIAKHRDDFKRSLDVARTLECGLVRVFTFLRDGARNDPNWVERVAEELRWLETCAAGSGIRIGVENESSCLVATASEVDAVLAKLSAESFGVIWDPCNVLYVPEAVPATPADVRRLAARIFHVHVKDAVRRGSTGVAMPVGAGDVGWRATLAELARIGYRGWLSLETHWRLVAIAESELHLPAGYAFSRGGDEASRVCARTLQSLLALTPADVA